MSIVSAYWTAQVNVLRILCSCGRTFDHRSDRWKVRCQCGCSASLSDLRDEYVHRHSEDSSDERPAQQGGSTMSTKHVKLYSDGACSGNPGPGGWAAILKYGQHTKEVVGGTSETTNNRAELMAVIIGLEALKRPCAVVIYTDSQYVVATLTFTWRRKCNLRLLARADALIAQHDLRFAKVKAHNGDPMNERCDQLAKAQVEQQRTRARSAAQAEDYDTCDRCYKRITGDELKRANRRSDYITYCDECNRRNNAGVAFPDNRPRLHPRRPIPSGFEQLPSAISDMAPVGAG